MNGNLIFNFKKMKTKAYRHWEIALVMIKEFPTWLEKVNQKEFLKWSHWNSHSFDNWELYLKEEDDFIFGYFVAKNTTLLHPEHWEWNDMIKKAKIEDWIYQLRVQNEFVNNELKQVID